MYIFTFFVIVVIMTVPVRIIIHNFLDTLTLLRVSVCVCVCVEIAWQGERGTPGEEVPGLIPAVAARFLLVGSVSV